MYFPGLSKTGESSTPEPGLALQPPQPRNMIDPHRSSKGRERRDLQWASPSPLLSEQEFACMYSLREWQRGCLHTRVQIYGFELL